ncbi:MAG TPA: type II toxin-antitoxin system HipA family toxin [Gammaproteobacteria bacterium]|nr:type II toxin-antitoxin system HipA family toxin [Gammaproteobacteria bacterium]
MDKKQLSVRLNGQPVGILKQTPTGRMVFTYDASAREAISVGMPLREEPYGEIQTEAYFGGLLPESETVKKIIGKHYGVSHGNSFALLKAIGYDCAGAISCHALDEPCQESLSFPLTTRVLTDKELCQHIRELPQKPLFMDVDGLRLSLAGVQDKAAVCLVDNQIALAENGCPTTHILKPSSPHFENMAENEYFCLRIAKALQLPVPDIQLKKMEDLTFLLIERYDRRIAQNTVTRVHQEDFCQGLGIVSTKKYQNEGGPGFKNCFELLKKSAQPAVDRNHLASVLVFNYLTGNMDAHGKNFSLLHHPSSGIRLAPFYDIVCTRVYPNLTTKMAMKIGSHYDTKHLLPVHWEQLCQAIQYRYISMKKLIQEQAESILDIAIRERENLKAMGYPVIVIDRIIKVMEENIRQVSNALAFN